MGQTFSVQVNIPAESGDMGILANHVPSIEQLKPGLVEIIEESGGSKQFFCMCASPRTRGSARRGVLHLPRISMRIGNWRWLRKKIYNAELT